MHISELVVEEKATPLQKFYEGANILITGGTGFLGKSKTRFLIIKQRCTHLVTDFYVPLIIVLLNKLFTSCPGIENIYILIRMKNNKDVHTRAEEIFDDPVSYSRYSP